MNRWHTGLMFLAGVVVLWVGSGFMVNAMSGEYDKPYFITYVNTGTFVVYLIPTLMKTSSYRKQRHRYQQINEEDESGPVPVSDPQLDASKRSTTTAQTKFSMRETAKIGIQFSLIWFTANLFNNASYLYTTVASATIIACTSSFFTLLLGVAFKIESFSIYKLFALIVSITGVGLVSLADGTDETAPPNALLGNFYALLSAILYGAYTTLLKYRVGDESRIDTKFFFGCVGLSNVVFIWPVLVLFHYLGIERFGLPPSSRIWWLLLLNGASTIISDFFWVLAMLMTSPLVVTVGLSATIPLSMVGDFILRHHFGSLMYLVGAAMVCWSFFAINRQEQEDTAVVGVSEEES